MLAISYIDQLERRALCICPSCIFFTRYIDDVLLLTSPSEEATTMYENIDKHIQFKIEQPDNNGSLSLLGLKMQISPTGKIYTNFSRKSTTKNLFAHFKSALPLSTKTDYIRNEIKRIHNRCSEEKDKTTHTAHFINTLRNIDYSISIIRHLNSKKSGKLHRPSNTCFLKLPHFSEIITKEIRRAIYKKGLDIRLAHSGPSQCQYLTKKNNNTSTTCT